MQTDSFAGMFDQNADQWARQEPMILSDFTARPLVLQELAPLTGKHVLDLGCGEGYVARLVAQAGAQSIFGIDISSEMVGRAQQAAASGAPCPMTFKSGNATNFPKNVKAKGIDLTKLDFVALSHRHSDHVSGLSYVLRVNPQVKIYAPKEGFGIFGSDLPSKFYRKDDSLPAEMRYYNGAPPETMKFGTLFPGANIQLIDKTTEVTPGITLIALISDAPGTKELKELSLAINTPDGLVLVVGCSHPGIEAIVAEAVKINPHIHFLTGGFHLVVAQDSVIEKVANALHDTYKVDYIAPGHCTGEPTFTALQKVFGDRYLYAGLGTTLSVGANPRAASNQNGAPVLDGRDSRSYHTLLAQSDDLHESGVSVVRLARVQ